MKRIYENKEPRDSLLEEAERVLDHARRNLPTEAELVKEMDKFSLRDKEDIKKYAASLEKVLKQDSSQTRQVKAAPKLFKAKYKKI